MSTMQHVKAASFGPRTKWVYQFILQAYKDWWIEGYNEPSLSVGLLSRKAWLSDSREIWPESMKKTDAAIRGILRRECQAHRLECQLGFDGSRHVDLYYPCAAFDPSVIYSIAGFAPDFEADAALDARRAINSSGHELPVYYSEATGQPFHEKHFSTLPREYMKSVVVKVVLTQWHEDNFTLANHIGAFRLEHLRWRSKQPHA